MAKSTDPKIPSSRESLTAGIQKLGQLIQDIEFAMLITHDAQGFLRGRPMATQRREFDGVLWFFTNDHSAKSVEIAKDQRVNLSYSKPGAQLYVSVSGTAQVVKDQRKFEEFWSPVYQAWFPKGLQDPELALIRVAVDHAEYWDSPSGKVAQIIGLAKSILTGEKYEAGEHQKVRMA